MFVRLTRVRKGAKVYEYHQLVESFRKPDGQPAHRVVASLNGLTPEQIANLKLALGAGRVGEAVVVPNPAQALPVITANRAYLDVAVVHALCQELGLGAMIDGLVTSEPDVAVGQVIEALVVHRCVAPASKLAAARWFPTTALPEITSVSPAQFNNSRLHRALNALQSVDGPLRSALRNKLVAEHGAWSATFLDLTDTWFFGRGPGLARSGQTKEGMQRQKIGIALLCDQRGFPIEWRVVQGGRSEARVMLEVLKDGKAEGWVNAAPVVMDRAMGRFDTITKLVDSDVRFVTALVCSEVESYTKAVPVEAALATQTAGTPGMRQRDQDRLAGAVTLAGMKPAGGGLFVVDLGVVQRERTDGLGDGPLMGGLLRRLMEMQGLVDEGGVSRSDIAARYGLSRTTLYELRKLLKLIPSIRERIFAGAAESLRVEELAEVAAQSPADQEATFEAMLHVAGQRVSRGAKPPKLADRARRVVPVRLVATFRTELCLENRATAAEGLKQLDELVASSNATLARRGCRVTVEQEMGRVREWLRRRKWIDLFAINAVNRRDGHDFTQLELTRIEEVWRRRRRWDGFVVIAAHNEVVGSAEAIAKLYWSRDVVERGFRTIKSEVELRPVHHQTDPKVEAHVTLCVLALLVLRTIEQRLRDAGDAMSAQAVLETLATCHLNQLRTRGTTDAYVLTEPTPDQSALLTALDFARLTSPEALATHEPRHPTA